MCEAVAVCHDIGVSHRDIKPENFICCDSVELETVHETTSRGGSGFGDRDGYGDEDEGGFGPQAKRKVIVKLTDFGLATTLFESEDMLCGSKPYMSYGKWCPHMNDSKKLADAWQNVETTLDPTTNLVQPTFGRSVSYCST